MSSARPLLALARSAVHARAAAPTARSAASAFTSPAAGAASRGFASVSARLDSLAVSLPYLEVAHFPEKGYKWSTSDVKVY